MLSSIPGRYLLLGTVFCCANLIAQERVPENPFREILTPEELGIRLESNTEEVSESIYLATETRYPAVGMLVRSISKGRNADKAGVRDNSIIFQRGKHKVWADYVPMQILHEPYTAKLIDPEGNEYEAQLDAGLLGIRARGEYHLEIAYLRGEVGTRDPKWDRQMLVACMTHSSDPELAETALHYAVKLGYPGDALSDFFRVIFQTFTETGPAKEVEQFFSHFEGKEIPWVYMPPLHNALVVSGRIDFMQRIADQAGTNAVYDPDTIKNFLQWTGGKVQLPEESLLQRALKARGPSLNDKLIGYRKGKPDPNGRKINSLLKISSMPGRYYSIEFQSDDLPRDIHYHARIWIQANGLSERFASNMRIGFVDRYDEDHGPIPLRYPRLGGVSFSHRHLFVSFTRSVYGTLISTSGNEMPGLHWALSPIIEIPYVADPDIPESLLERYEKTKRTPGDEPKPIDVDLIRYKNEMAVFVNGVRHLHLPSNPEPDRKISVALHIVGLKVTMKKLAIWELTE